MRDFSEIKRIVIKIGTNTLAKDSGVDSEYIASIAGQVAGLIRQGKQVLIISSGAIGMGAGQLQLDGPVGEMKMRQACAAIGQPMLMAEYRKAFAMHSITVAQVLLTAEVLANRKTYLNLRNSIETLLNLTAVPIMNENDSVSTEEIGSAFGDNDTLSALVASKIDADLLIILSDIDGLYDMDPRKHGDAQKIEAVYEITKDIEKAAGTAGTTHSTGGMKTKIEAAKIASNAGCRIVLADGKTNNVIERIIEGENIGTIFMPKCKLSNRTRWILNSTPAGTITIDEGALNALGNRKSLLPSGITAVTGTFDAGSVVMLNDAAKAVCSFSSEELTSLIGKHSSEIRQILGKHRKDVVATPEDIVFLT